jgi:hypothetical protein
VEVAHLAPQVVEGYGVPIAGECHATWMKSRHKTFVLTASFL